MKVKDSLEINQVAHEVTVDLSKWVNKGDKRAGHHLGSNHPLNRENESDLGRELGFSKLDLEGPMSPRLKTNE